MLIFMTAVSLWERRIALSILNLSKTLLKKREFKGNQSDRRLKGTWFFVF